MCSGPSQQPQIPENRPEKPQTADGLYYAAGVIELHVYQPRLLKRGARSIATMATPERLPDGAGLLADLRELGPVSRQHDLPV